MNEQDILKKIDDLYFEISHYHQELNNESIWLFLATLACYSVTFPAIKAFAMAITFYIFVQKADTLRKQSHTGTIQESFNNYIHYLRILSKENIKQLDLREQCDAKLNQCQKLIEMKNLCSQKNAIFFLSFTFWGISAFVFIWNDWINPL